DRERSVSAGVDGDHLSGIRRQRDGVREGSAGRRRRAGIQVVSVLGGDEGALRTHGGRRALSEEQKTAECQKGYEPWSKNLHETLLCERPRQPQPLYFPLIGVVFCRSSPLPSTVLF